MKSRALRGWLFRGVGLALLALILARTDLEGTADVLRRAEPLPVVAATLLIFPMIACKTARWRSLQRAVGLSAGSFAASYRSYFTGLYAGLVTPGRVGEFLRVRHLTEAGAPLPAALATVIWDRIFDVLGLLLLGALALAPLAGEFRGLYLGALLLLLLGVAAAAALVLVPSGRPGGLRARLRARLDRGGPLLRKVVEGAAGTLRASRSFRGGLVARAGLWTLAGWACYYLQAWILARSLAIPLAPLALVVSVTGAAVAAFLPLSISGIGTRDAALVLLFGTLGRPREEALAFSALILLMLLANALFGFLAAQWGGERVGKPIPKIDSGADA